METGVGEIGGGKEAEGDNSMEVASQEMTAVCLTIVSDSSIAYEPKGKKYPTHNKQTLYSVLMVSADQSPPRFQNLTNKNYRLR